MEKFKVVILIVINVLLISCTDYSVEIHVDEIKKAMISCNGNVMHRVSIKSSDSDTTYYEADTIYFNRRNSANDYILKLKPNSVYQISSYSSNGDQGPYNLTLKTDKKGNIIHDQENDCR